MSLTDIQLYANNAKSVLQLAIGSSDTAFSVQAGQGARFPAISSSREFFLVTLESAGVVEIVKVTGRVNDSFVAVRGQEGTSASSFPAGAQVQMRVTRDTLSSFARLTDRLGDILTLDDLPAVSEASGNSYLSQKTDDSGNPIVVVKSLDRWRFPTHSSVHLTGVAQASTTTSISNPSFAGLDVAEGRFILNFTSGALAGQTRYITGISGDALTWDTPFSVAPAVGIGFELLVSNSYVLSLTAGFEDESIINAIIFGS